MGFRRLLHELPRCRQRWGGPTTPREGTLISLVLCCFIEQCESAYEDQGLCLPTGLKQVPRHKNPLTLFANAKAAPKNEAKCSEQHPISTLHVPGLFALSSSMSHLPGSTTPHGGGSWKMLPTCLNLQGALETIRESKLWGIH